jgi:hypothetical protein
MASGGYTQTDRRRPIIPVVLSAVLGLVAATGAAAAIVSANSPNDGDAVQNGPAEVVDPAVVLNYGG